MRTKHKKLPSANETHISWRAGVLAPQQELQREIDNLRRLAQQHDAALEECRGAPPPHHRPRVHRKLYELSPSARRQ